MSYKTCRSYKDLPNFVGAKDQVGSTVQGSVRAQAADNAQLNSSNTFSTMSLNTQATLGHSPAFCTQPGLAGTKTTANPIHYPAKYPPCEALKIVMLQNLS